MAVGTKLQKMIESSGAIRIFRSRRDELLAEREKLLALLRGLEDELRAQGETAEAQKLHLSAGELL